MNAIQIDREKIRNILGIDFLCVKIDLSHKQSHRVIDDLRCIIYYIIYTLMRIENVFIVLRMHTAVDTGSGSRTDLENLAYKLTIIIQI
jgi:hypothetical protein